MLSAVRAGASGPKRFLKLPASLSGGVHPSLFKVSAVSVVMNGKFARLTDSPSRPFAVFVI